MRKNHILTLAAVAVIGLGVSACGSGGGGSTGSGGTTINGTANKCLYSFSEPMPFGVVANVCMKICPTGTIAECPVLARIPLPITVVDTAAPGAPASAGTLDPRPQRCGCTGGVVGDATRNVLVFKNPAMSLK